MNIKEALELLKIKNCPGWGPGIPYLKIENVENRDGKYLILKAICGRAVNIRDDELPKVCRVCPIRRNTQVVSQTKI